MDYSETYSEFEDIILTLNKKLPADFYVVGGSIPYNQKPLYREEKTIISGASKSQIREFTAGRAIAKKALKGLGMVPGPILRGAEGCPVWPKGSYGSISHKGGVCGALVGTAANYFSAGIDIEYVESLDKSVWSAFAAIEEVAQGRQNGLSESVFANVLFSAKESLFKCLFPVFEEATPPISKLKVGVSPSGRDYALEARVGEACCFGGVICRRRYLISWMVSEYEEPGQFPL